jgi:hypothetical protein
MMSIVPPEIEAPERIKERPRVQKAQPPEWPIEKFVLQIGRGPAALKRVLDGAAKLPVLKPILRFFNSVWVGITLLFLIGVYVGIGSGFASLRARMEMTDLEFFNAWPMQVLIGLLAVNLTVVTLRRIPLTVFKLGVWTVHIGILTLLAGCIWYFSQKYEGSVRVFLNQSVSEFYDATERSLYVYKIRPDGTVDLASETMTPLPKLPIYNEHIANEHNPSKNNPLNIQLPSSTLGGVNPALSDATLKIVGYYPSADLVNDWQPAPTGSATSQPATNSSKPGGRAILFSFSAAGYTGGNWLVANSPAARTLDVQQLPFGVEYLRHPTEQQLADIQAEITGPVGLTVRVPEKNVTKTYTMLQGKPVVVEGTPYTLIAIDQMQMPLISKGYEGATGNTLTVKIARQDGDKLTTFDRMVVGRYPEISPDFITDENGQKKRIQERVDNNIQLTYHDAQRHQFWMVEHADATPDKKIELFHRPAGGGKVTRMPMAMGTPISFPAGSGQIRIGFMGETENAVQTLVPRITPPEERPLGQTAMDAMQFSVIELSFSKGPHQDERCFVPFVQFAKIADPPLGRQPSIIHVPGVGTVGFILSTTRRKLPTTITLTDFEAIKYQGAASNSRSYEDYVSTIQATDAAGKTETLTARLNNPAESHGLYYFQSGWDGNDNAPPEKRFSILGVGNRPGLTTMLVGSILIVIGIGYAFYIKPILLNAKKKSLAAWAAAQQTAA